jgi:hypothetical protein
MPDNLENRGPRDATRVNVNEEWELRYWCRRFGVSPEQLRAAVGKVGVMVSDVEQALAVKQ